MARARSGGSGYAVAVVIFGAGFVICLLLAIVFYAQLGGARQGAQEANTQLSNYANEQQRQNPTIAEMKSKGGTVVGQLLDQNQKLSNKVNNLQNQAQQLDAKITALQARRDAAEQARQQAQEAAKQARRKADQLSQTFNQKAQGLQGNVSKLASTYDEYGSRINTVRTNIKQQVDKQTQSNQAQVQRLQEQLADTQQKLQQTQHEFDVLRDKFPRAQNATQNITQPDATISSKLGDDQVTLNIGSNQRVTLGMSFEVFGPDQLIKLNEYDELRGKATVEVFELHSNSATARVVRRSPRGGSIQAGDAAVNLVYSPDTTYKFYIYGKFDINGSGNATDRGRERIQNLVSKWGGNLTDDLSYDDDFLVLGEEPPAPKPLSDNVVDPVIIQQNVEARKTFQTYQNLIAKANELGIPVLNQNRFLALVGYFQRS